MAADVIDKAQAVLSELELLRAIFDVGYLPPNTPPGERAGGSYAPDNGLLGGRPARPRWANNGLMHRSKN